MGLVRGTIQLLLDECARERFSGSVLTLGRQFVFIGMEELQQAAARRGMALAPAEVLPSFVPELAAKGYIDDGTLLKSLGFREVVSTDYSDFEGADLMIDLNLPVPEELRERFDVIINAGTLEHVFHFPQALANLHFMLRPNGRIMHSSPTSNFVDHGFYQVSPTLFWDYYKANEYAIRSAFLLRNAGSGESSPWEVIAYEPGLLDCYSYGGLDEAKYGTVFIVQKTEQSTSDRIPMQGVWRPKWDKTQSSAAGHSLPKSFNDRLLDSTQGIPLVGGLARLAVGGYRRAVHAAHERGLRLRRRPKFKIAARY